MQIDLVRVLHARLHVFVRVRMRVSVGACVCVFIARACACARVYFVCGRACVWACVSLLCVCLLCVGVHVCVYWVRLLCMCVCVCGGVHIMYLGLGSVCTLTGLSLMVGLDTHR